MISSDEVDGTPVIVVVLLRGRDTQCEEIRDCYCSRSLRGPRPHSTSCIEVDETLVLSVAALWNCSSRLSMSSLEAHQEGAGLHLLAILERRPTYSLEFWAWNW